MKACSLISNLEDESRIIGPEDISSLIHARFSDPALATVYLETTKIANLTLLRDFSFPTSFATCHRLIVSDERCEVRLEHKQKSDLFFCRILEEAEGDDFLYREDKLVLRKTQHIAPSIFCNEKGHMRQREYFCADKDGMYCFYADRLAGFCID